ncbi:MAG: VCBS repeat-containing protein, partial [Acidobacteriota bacterium]
MRRAQARLLASAGLCSWLLIVAPASARADAPAAPASAVSETAAGTWQFVDGTADAGLDGAQHSYLAPGTATEPDVIAGGVAAGDYDGDGWPDLFFVTGDAQPNRLYRNQGDGTFAEVGAAAGVAGALGRRQAGPAWIDLDGNGWLDLIIGAVDQLGVDVYWNNGDGTFTADVGHSGLERDPPRTGALRVYGVAAGDGDGDGDLDLALARWSDRGHQESPRLLWRNQGDGRFFDVSQEAGLGLIFQRRFVFTPFFADLDGNDVPDLALAQDFGNSSVFLDDGPATQLRYRFANTDVIDDENGMGAALADYDNDGDLDWFVTSIHDPDGIPEGN